MEIQLDGDAWTLGDPLAAGEGGFGKVYEVHADGGSAAVAKFVRKIPGAEREMLIGDSLQARPFRNIIPIIDHGEHGDFWVLVMPKAERSLEDYLQSLDAPPSIAETVSILTDISTALEDFEGVVVHRDLKPANILLYNGTWCVADFGISRYAEATTAHDTRKLNLTAQYAAPEQWRAEHATSATDIYAFGVISYRLLSGTLPFNGPDKSDYREQHLRENPPALKSGTPKLRILTEECLFKAPESRPKAKNIVARLATAANEPLLPGLARLAQVSHIQTQREAKLQAQDSRDREESERRRRVFASAEQAFSSFSVPLLRAIEENAPNANIEIDAGRGTMCFVAELSGAKIGISKPRESDEWDGPFTVIADATISVRASSKNRGGLSGRAHSLWYCDAHEKGAFAWYETSFMSPPFGGSSMEPYSRSPQEAGIAFQNIIGTIQLAWPFEELDRSDPAEFLSRWISWFADAAEGHLTTPSVMPEKPTNGSWRH